MRREALDIIRTMTMAAPAVLLLILAGCAQPPTQQLEAAQKAVEAARAAGAQQYAMEEFVQLEQQMNSAKQELAKQEEALIIFRSYAEAEKLLTRVAGKGPEVEAHAAAQKDAAKTKALAGEKEAQQATESVRELLAKAPVGKDRVAVESLKQDVAGLEGSLKALHDLIEKGDYLAADTQAKVLKEKAAAIAGEIQTAIAKVKGAKQGA
jgi:hypothetical protein